MAVAVVTVVVVLGVMVVAVVVVLVVVVVVACISFRKLFLSAATLRPFLPPASCMNGLVVVTLAASVLWGLPPWARAPTVGVLLVVATALCRQCPLCGCYCLDSSEICADCRAIDEWDGEYWTDAPFPYY